MTPAQEDFLTLTVPDGELLKVIRQVLDKMAARGQPVNPAWLRWLDRMNDLQAGRKPHYVGSLTDDELVELAH